MKHKNYKIKYLFLFLLLNSIVYSQSSTVQLLSDDNTSSFDVLKNDNTALLRIFGDGGFYLNGTLNTGNIPVSGAGTRMMWFPARASFRAGAVESFGATYWDLANIGFWSVAMGRYTRASGNNSFAVNLATTASGNQSVALGNNGTASADNSIAFNGTASGVSSISLGSGAQATSDSAIALGPSSISGGISSITIGPSITSGLYSISIGLQNSTKGAYAFTIGKNARNYFAGSMVLGDGSAGFSSDSVYNTAYNQMTMRFAGAFRLFSNAALTLGVILPSGGSSWSAVSDSSKKENFIYADGEYFLNSISKLKLGTWNYKTQNSSIRHYGPMAQEIFHYFGKDALGTIGNDTTLAAADMDGIIMICLQALEKRTRNITGVQDDLNKMSKKINLIENDLMLQNMIIDDVQDKVSRLKTRINNVKEKMSGLEAEKKIANNLAGIKK